MCAEQKTIKVRLSKERGYEDKGWLETFHTFSFDTYYDPNFLGFHQLRVLNEDVLKGGKGFGANFHKDVEILTYVLEGVLEHKDSTGSTSVIRPGEILLISSGSGVTHSEYNLSHHLPVHFFQIWISPNRHQVEPSYKKKLFSPAAKWGQWCLLVSQTGREGSLRIHQDADIYALLLDEQDEIDFAALPGRHYWVQIVDGEFLIHETHLKKGDAISFEEETNIEIKCLVSGELLLFDLGP